MHNETVIERLRRTSRRQRRAQGSPLVLPSPAVPMLVAREFVKQSCVHEGSILTLRYWHGGWWAWRGSHWMEVESRSVRAWLYTFTEHARYMTREGPMPWAPTRRKIG